MACLILEVLRYTQSPSLVCGSRTVIMVWNVASKLTGNTLLWLVGLNAIWDCLSPNGLWAHVTSGNFHHFSKAGLCKGTVKYPMAWRKHSCTKLDHTSLKNFPHTFIHLAVSCYCEYMEQCPQTTGVPTEVWHATLTTRPRGRCRQVASVRLKHKQHRD